MNIRSQINIVLTALLIPLGWTAPTFAVNPADLQQLLETRACQGCDLQGADLREAHLIGADLRDANLQGAILAGANLEGADLTGANLEGANLTNTFLNSADLTNVNFAHANLRDANLIQAQLEGANLVATNLSGAEMRVSHLSAPQLLQVQSFYPELMSQQINTLPATTVPGGQAADFGAGLNLSVDNGYLIGPIGGPSLYEPFGYDAEYLNEVFPPQSLRVENNRFSWTWNLPTHNVTVQPFELTQFEWKNPDGSWKSTGYRSRFGF